MARIKSIRRTCDDDTMREDGSGWRVWFDAATAITDESGEIEWASPSMTMTDEIRDEVRVAIQRATDGSYASDELYIRFGELPESGRSTNHATGEVERGISCYDARWSADGCYEIVGNALVGAIVAYRISGAPVYLMRGSRVGTGSDGEPLISDAKILCELEGTSDNVACTSYARIGDGK